MSPNEQPVERPPLASSTDDIGPSVFAAGEMDSPLLADIRQFAPTLAKRVAEVSALMVFGTKRYSPTKIKRSMALKATLFGACRRWMFG